MIEDEILLDDDATPTFRGFRRQALYILYRILNDDKRNHYSYGPEFKEDLTIFDKQDNIIEVIQVKDYEKELYLSNFKPKKENSFFNRIAQLISRNQNLLIKIVSYGPISKQLNDGFSNDYSKMNSFAQKLSKYEYISFEKAQKIIESSILEKVEDSFLTQEIQNYLLDSFTGIDINSAFDLLLYYIYKCSEEKIKITQLILFDKINTIGKFLTERSQYQKEWFSNIKPFKDLNVPSANSEKLQEEFYQGVAARYEHICAGFDVIRYDKLDRIYTAFIENNIVIIHGASGQGKTALSLRYFHDYLSEEVCFKIYDIENISHAHIISEALINHYKSINIPFFIQFDVSPSNPYWVQLIRHIANYQNIKALITIREEDWKRSNINGYDFDFKDIELAFDMNEAEIIFNHFTKDKPSKNFISFKDCWSLFGESGPLLEFTYVLKQGKTLHSRLKEQVNILNDRCRKGELQKDEMDFLRMIAVVSAYEGRLDLRSLQKKLNLTAPQRTLELFEKEYLVKKMSNGFLVGALHPIRSAILSDLLIDGIFNTWVDVVTSCFSSICETDIENFLLFSFSRRPQDREQLIKFLNSFSPKNWLTYSGIIHALLWVGIKHYVNENEQLIKEIFRNEQDSYKVIFNSDITSCAFNEEPWWKTMDIPEATRVIYTDYAKKQTNSEMAFVPLKNWLNHRRLKPEKPISDKEFLGIGETIFWSDFLKVEIPIIEWNILEEINEKFGVLSLETLSNLISGFFLTQKAQLKEWYKKHFINLVDLLCKETNIVAITEKDKEIKAHFFIPIESENDNNEHSYFEQTMFAINYLKRLFPFYDVYSSQGYGHKTFFEGLNYDHDDTFKCIPKRLLPHTWLTSANSIVSELISKPFKLKTWKEYVNNILDKRESLIYNFEKLLTGLNNYYINLDGTIILKEGIDVNEWAICLKKIEFDPGLPECVLDEWGIIKETSTKEPNNKMIIETPKGLSIKKYADYLKMQNDYFYFIKCFFWNVNRVLPDYINKKFSQKNYELPIFNYTDSIKRLPKFQSNFQNLFFRYCNIKQLEELEKRELYTFQKLWSTWYHFIYYPNHVKKNAVKRCYDQIHKNFINNFKQTLRQKFRNSNKSFKLTLLENIPPLEEDHPALWIKADSSEFYDIHEAAQFAINIIDKIIKSKGVRSRIGRILYYHWNFIYIIGCIRGRIALPVIQRISSLSFITGDFKPFSLPIPEDFLDKLCIKIEDSRQIKIANGFYKYFYKLKQLISHFNEFFEIPDNEHGDSKNLTAYISNHLNRFFNESGQELINQMSHIVDIFHTLQEEEYESRINFVLATQLLGEIYPKIIPQKSEDGFFRIELNKQTIPQWKSSLDQVEEDVSKIYILILTDYYSNKK